MSNFYTEPFVSAGEMEFPARPYITAQPQNHTATGPETYVLKVIAAGAVSYQWEVYNGISWASIPGATSDTLTITIDPSMNGWRYRVIVTGADGSTVVSKAAQIAVRGVHECTLKGAIVTFNGPAEITSLEVDINAVQAGSGDPSPTNVRPISGWDSVNVFVRGKNLWNKTLINGYTQIDNLKIGTTYTVTAQMVNASENTYCYVQKAVSGTANRETIGRVIVGTTTNAITFTVESGYDYFLWCNASYINTTSVQVEVGSTASSYEPYNGTTYPITLPNTVYGGKIKDGVLTVTHSIVNLGALPWAYNYSQMRFTTTLADAKLPPDNNTKANIICSHYKTVSNNENININNTCGLSIYSALGIKDTAYTDVTTFKQMLTDNNAQLVYELAVPIEIYLSDYPTITVLTGTNNIWADSGDISVTVII